MSTRYFQTTNASQPLRLGRFSFEFEPTGVFGGAWWGILKTEDDEQAQLLASHGGAVTELSPEDYEIEKKKLALKGQPIPVSKLSSQEALEIHQRSLGVVPAAPKPSTNASSASPVGSLDVGAAEIIDDLEPGSNR